MSPDELWSTFHAARTYAGSGLSSLAHAWFLLDPQNRQRLQDAFPEIISSYGPTSPFYRHLPTNPPR